MAKKVIDPAPIIKELADRCLKAKGLECSVLGSVIDLLKAAPAVYNAPYWATEEAYKNGYEAGKRDAVQVVHGRWIPLEYDGYADGNPVWDLWECSECQEEHSGDEDTLTPYCPNCGAKMEGE